MNQYQSGSPTLFERCFAAVFSGMAAGITYAVFMYFRWGQWSAEQMDAVKDMGKWAVLGGAVLGFLGGISMVTWLWGQVWETRNDNLISLRTALVLLCLGGIAYGMLKS